MIGVLVAIVFWMLSGSALSGYELDVRVLRPWMRWAYGTPR